MDKKIAAMDLALSHIGMDVPEKTVREMADIFLHALADDLPDDMVERGARRFEVLHRDTCYPEAAAWESIAASRSILQAALKGAA